MRGEKMSKSKGNLLSADELLERYGVDSVRFYLTAFGPERKDINFTEEDFKQAHNKYLVGVLGNFVNRNLAFIQNKQEGIFRGAEVDAEVAAKTRETYEEAGKLIEKAELRAAVNTVFEYANFANKYYDAKTPWVLFKNDKAEFDKVAYSCLYIIANLSNLIQPFLPNAAAKIKEMIGIEQKTSWDIVALKDDIKIEKTELLFQRL
jgi:methionyl-tRNA synthetase